MARTAKLRQPRRFGRSFFKKASHTGRSLLAFSIGLALGGVAMQSAEALQVGNVAPSTDTNNNVQNNNTSIGDEIVLRVGLTTATPTTHSYIFTNNLTVNANAGSPSANEAIAVAGSDAMNIGISALLEFRGGLTINTSHGGGNSIQNGILLLGRGPGNTIAGSAEVLFTALTEQTVTTSFASIVSNDVNDAEGIVTSRITAGNGLVLAPAAAVGHLRFGATHVATGSADPTNSVNRGFVRLLQAGDMTAAGDLRIESRRLRARELRVTAGAGTGQNSALFLVQQAPLAGGNNMSNVQMATLNDRGGNATLNIEYNAAVTTFGGTIDRADTTAEGDGRAILQVFTGNGLGGAADPIDFTFNGAVGATIPLSEINIGNMAFSRGGEAIFSQQVRAGTITVRSTNTQSGIIQLRGDATGNIDLRPSSAQSADLLIIGTGAQTITGNISASNAANATSEIIIYDTDNAAAPDLVTITGNVTGGATLLVAQDDTRGGSVRFDGDVNLRHFQIFSGNTNQEATRVDFNGDVVIAANATDSAGNPIRPLLDASDVAEAGIVVSFAGDVAIGQAPHVLNDPQALDLRGELTTAEMNRGGTAINFDGTAAQTISGALFSFGQGAQREGRISALNTSAEGATFSAGYFYVREVLIGNGTTPGRATFNSEMILDLDQSLEVRGGDAANEVSTATFEGRVAGDGTSAGILDITVLGGSAANTQANAIFAPSATLRARNISVEGGSNVGGVATLSIGSAFTGSVTLNDSAGRARFVLGGATRTVANSITAAANNEGTVGVLSGEGIITFDQSAGLGTAANTLREVSVGGTVVTGTGSDAGHAVFSRPVRTVAVNVVGGDAATEDSTAGFTNTVSAQTVSVTGGSHAEADATATFATTISGLTNLTVSGGSVTGADATAVLNRAVAGATVTLQLDENNGSAANGHGSAAINFNIANADATIENQIRAVGAGEGTVRVLSGIRRLTFTQQVGTLAQGINELEVGSSTQGGIATFNSIVNTNQVEITGGDDANELSSATFLNNLTGNVLLNDGTGANTGTTLSLIGSLPQVFTGSVAAQSDGEGIVEVYDPDNNQVPDLVVLTGSIGAPGRSVSRLNFGSRPATTNITLIPGQLADAVQVRMVGAVYADSMELFAGNSPLENTTVDFDGPVFITGASPSRLYGRDGIMGAVANSNVSLSFAGDLTVTQDQLRLLGAPTRNDLSSGNVTVVFDGTVRQDVSGNVTSEIVGANREGTVRIINTSVDGVVYSAGGLYVRDLEIGDGSTRGGATFQSTMTGSGLPNGSSGTRAVDIGRRLVVTGGDGANEISTATFNTAVAGAGNNVPGNLALTVQGGSGSAGSAAIATFTQNLAANAVNVTGGGGSNATATLNIANTLTGTGDINLDDGSAGAGAAQVVFTGAARTVASRVFPQGNNEGTLRVLSEGNLLTFNRGGGAGGLLFGGSATRLQELAVGDGAVHGTGTFVQNAHVNTVTVRGGDATGETSRATFAGSVFASSMTVTGGGHMTADAEVTLDMSSTVDVATVVGGSVAGSDGLLTLRGSLSASSGVRLNDNAGDAILAFIGDARSVANTIVAVANDEGAVRVLAGANRITFSRSIGTQSLGLKLVTVGDGMVSGTTTFAAVDAATVNIIGGDAAGEASSAIFSGVVEATTVAVMGGSHGGGDATATFSAAGSTLANLNVTGGSATGANAAVTFGNALTLNGAVRLDDGGAGTTLNLFGTSGATLTFSGSAAQSIVGTIDAQAQGEGTVHVLNTHASGTTFGGVIGGTQRVGRLRVGSQSVQGIATFNRGVTVGALRVFGGDGAGEASSATFGAMAPVDATTVTVFGGSHASARASVTFNGTTTVGTLTLVAGDTAGAVPSVTVLGNFTGNIALNYSDEETVLRLAFSGAAAQTVTGNMTRIGTSADPETVVVNNPHAQGVTFAGTIAAGIGLSLGTSAGGGRSVTFQGDVASALVVGNVAAAVDDTFTVTYANQASDITVSAGLTIADAGDTVHVHVVDDTANAAPDTTTFSAALGNNIDTFTVGSTSQGGSAVLSAAIANRAIGSIRVIGGDNAAEDSRLRFDSDVGTGISIIIDDNAGDAVVQFNDANGGSFEEPITRLNEPGAGMAVLEITDATPDALPDALTFGDAIGGASGSAARLDAVRIGSAMQAGSATFTGVVRAVTITVQGGNNAAEDSSVVFGGNVTSTDLNIMGSTTDGATARVTFTGSATSSGTIRLNDEDNGSTASVTFANTGEATQGAAIRGDAVGEGVVTIVDQGGGAPAQQTFNQIIGATRIGALVVGEGNNAGNAVFGAAVTSQSIQIAGGAQADEGSTGQFNGATTATTVTVSGGGHGDGDATAMFAAAGNTVTNLNVIGGSASDANAGVTFGNTVTLNGAVNLDEGGAGTSGATVTFSGSAMQTVAGAIDAASDSAGEGVVEVLNTNSSGAVFNGVIGGSRAIRLLRVGNSDGHGIADFNFGLTANMIEIVGGDGGSETSTVTFDGSVNGTTVTVTGGGNASADAEVTFNEAVDVVTLTVVGGRAAGADAEVTFTNNIRGNVALNDATGSAQVTFGAANATVTGNVGSAADGEGRVLVNSTTGTVITGNIGTAAVSNQLGSLVVGNTQANSTLTARGNVYVDTITLGTNSSGQQNATLNLESFNAEQVISGALSGNAPDLVVVNVRNTDGGSTPETTTFTGALTV